MYVALCPLLLLLLLQAAPLLLISAAAAVGCHAAAPSAAAALAAPLQGLPLAAPRLLLLLLQIMGRTIVCSGVLPSPGLELMTAP